MTKSEQLTFLKQWYASNKGNLQTQQALIAAIKADNQVENTIRTLYLALFNQSVSGCGNCLADAFTQLYHYPEEKMAQIETCKFKLRSGVLLQDVKNVLPMTTAANLTDEIAIAYLRDNINRKDLFQVLPDNLEEILKEPETTPKPKATRKAKK